MTIRLAPPGRTSSVASAIVQGRGTNHSFISAGIGPGLEDLLARRIEFADENQFMGGMSVISMVSC
jgi:hypothetical protein